jgi:hypothetical protein
LRLRPAQKGKGANAEWLSLRGAKIDRIFPIKRAFDGQTILKNGQADCGARVIGFY